MTMRIDWLQGCATALVTPFLKDGSIDDDCFKSLVDRQIKGGVKILVPCGTTGESATMSGPPGPLTLPDTRDVAVSCNCRSTPERSSPDRNVITVASAAFEAAGWYFVGYT